MHQDIQECDERINEPIDKVLMRNNKSSHTSLAFKVTNHAEEKKGKARMTINEKSLMIILCLMVIVFLPKQFFLVEFKTPLGSRKHIAIADIGI